MCGCANLYIVMVDIVSVQMRKCVCKSEDAWTSSPALGPPLSMHPGRLQSAQMCLLEPTYQVKTVKLGSKAVSRSSCLDADAVGLTWRMLAARERACWACVGLRKVVDVFRKTVDMKGHQMTLGARSPAAWIALHLCKMLGLAKYRKDVGNGLV